MNAAVAQHLRFGRDVIFTFGPLTSAYTGEYSPTTDVAMIVASLVVAVSIFLSLRVIVGPRNRAWLLGFPWV